LKNYSDAGKAVAAFPAGRRGMRWILEQSGPQGVAPDGMPPQASCMDAIDSLLACLSPAERCAE